MTVREIDPERDAEQVVALILKTNPTAVTSRDEWLHRRRAIPERAQLLARVAVRNDRIVGALEAGIDFFGSGDVARLAVRVDPDARRQGIGGRLYEIGLRHVRMLGVSRVAAASDVPEGGAFAIARGWRVTRAEVLSSVDPTSVTDVADESLDLRPARELDPRELHAVDEEATRDMPSVEPINAIPYEDWRALVWENPLFTRDGSFGVVVDGRLGALSLVVANPDAKRALSMFTGTLRPYRGRGLGRAVKLASIGWAAEQGITQLVTTNDETNVPMLAINRRLGYQPMGRRVEYVLDLSGR